MKLAAKIERDGKWWLVAVPLLDAMTQGRTRKEAYEMVVDLVETMADTEEFKATVAPVGGGALEIGSNDAATLIALVLRRQREKAGLSLAQVSKRLGFKSRNAYARYEQGKSVPTVAKLGELMGALGAKHDFVLAESKARPA